MDQPASLSPFETFARERCITCGGAGTMLYRDLTDVLFSAPGRWSMRKCASRACGMAWLDPQPAVADIGKLYEGYWTHGDGTVPAPNAEAGSKRANQLRSLLSFALPWRFHALRSEKRYLRDRPPGRLLDVGCGQGEFAAGMAERGWSAEGIDFDEGAVRVARQQPGVTTASGSIIDQAYPADCFDAITMSNVIEHVSDPVETVAECHRVLTPGGRLVMITPNIASTGHRLFGQDWRGLEVPRHLYLYTPGALAKLARGAGFRWVHAFASPGAVGMMLDASAEIATHAGRTPLGGLAGIARREKLKALLGSNSGEWAVLLAEK